MLESWFIELENVITEFNILPENIYNMDETGFNIGDFEARHVVVDTSVKFETFKNTVDIVASSSHGHSPLHS